MKNEIDTNTTKSPDNKPQTFTIEAPSTFRIPISFFRCSATNEINPNNPRQDMNTASPLKTLASRPTRSSLLNFRA